MKQNKFCSVSCEFDQFHRTEASINTLESLSVRPKSQVFVGVRLCSPCVRRAQTQYLESKRMFYGNIAVFLQNVPGGKRGVFFLNGILAEFN